MNVVCFAGHGPAGTHFVNRIHDEIGVELVIRERRRTRRELITRKYRSHGRRGVIDASMTRFHERRRSSPIQTYDRWFGDSWRELSPDISVLLVNSINDAEVVDRVAQLDDVVLAVEAPSIVRPHVLQACADTLNVHWGLSPYYRGTRCTEWALLHWDPRNIGPTVHELSMEVDGGAIIGQARAAITPTDNVESINVQVAALGAKIAVEALRHRRGGRGYARIPQDLTQGDVFYNRMWGHWLSRQVVALERSGLSRLIASPSRGKLPIIELSSG